VFPLLETRTGRYSPADRPRDIGKTFSGGQEWQNR
jgi:hypothetical protein